MLDNIASSPESPTTKITAEQIKKGCPTAIEVEALGYRIRAHLKTMRGYEAKAREKAGVELRKADDNWTTVTQLLAEAKEKCSTGGFKAFKEKFCPNLSRSRIYQLLEIGTGKKTLEGSRAEKRASVAKSRKKGKKVSTTNDVVDKSAAEPSPMKLNLPAPIETAIDGTPEVKPGSAPKLPSEAVAGATLGSVIEREWLEAEQALEALTRHRPAQAAKVIDPFKVSLITEIANWFVDLKTELTTRAATNGESAGPNYSDESPTAGPNYAIPDDPSIPHFLRRDVS